MNAKSKNKDSLSFFQIPAPDFNLQLTIESGQVFHWIKTGKGYWGLIGKTPLYVEQDSGVLFVSKGTETVVRNYFALDHPIAQIYKTFPDDPAMRIALEFCCGLRIMRQPVWECLATFITSSLKQVMHIQQMSHAIRQKFGERINFGNYETFAYPSAARLAEATEQELRTCRLGFRAKNLLGTAQMIASGELDLDEIHKMNDQDACKELCKLPGVGEKVANCVLLFAYERLHAFPIDVWIERVLREIYFKRKRKVTTKRLKIFSEEYFGPFGGYAQQYFFHYARMTYRKQKKAEISKSGI